MEYDDILHLPHHQSPTRARMSPENRAAQFAPFAALTGFDAAIREAARQTQPRLWLTEEALSALDARLRLLRLRLSGQPQITVTYFRPDDRKPGGAYLVKTGILSRIDPNTRELTFEDGEQIPFPNLYAITGDIFPEE